MRSALLYSWDYTKRKRGERGWGIPCVSPEAYKPFLLLLLWERQWMRGLHSAGEGAASKGLGHAWAPLLPQMSRVWHRISKEARQPSTGNTWCLLLECFCVFVAGLDLSPGWMLVCVPDLGLSFPLYFNIRDIIKKVSLKQWFISLVLLRNG